MPLSNERIQAFAEVWEREFGEQLTIDQAEEQAKRFLDLCWLLAQPLPREPGHRSRPPQVSP